ncbi:type I-F CRISPR-associated protein Csy3 [Ignatzschineria larvae DSM 13226]|uniref:Type I-F CRISPR-associated protein Csy3 n=1 Tax=Ignatzschineria larvae DSM 13226 TaxID=1111732 RepID=A0ABZ3BX62_9GAMM|nr:type I-F CRISPR-associated protein Csy3 [Ignatzschineria larvae]
MAIKLPSMLSFERKLEISDALMFSGDWSTISNLQDEKEAESAKNWQKIPITKRQNRSTQSAEGTPDDKKKQPNPASSDSDDANLPLEHDTLKVSFSMRIIGNLGIPFGCNSPEFSEAIQDRVTEFKAGEGVDILGHRYAYNIANGRFLWRNRVGAEEILIKVKVAEEQFEFMAYDFSLTDFDKNKENQELQKLGAIISDALKSDHQNFALIEVEAFVKLGKLQHVFPSQEMNMGEKGKTLFQLGGGAAMHNVKIGNAIRTIDTWYPRYDDMKIPIAIEPFGAVTQIGDAFRKNRKEGDLYSLMVDWINGKDLTIEEQAYVVGNLIRGGVFSSSK